MAIHVRNQKKLDNLYIKYNLNEITDLYCYGDTNDISITLKMTNLTHLQCSNTNVSEIPELNNLKVLYCYNTNVSKIPQLNNLQYLYCRNTNVKSFKDIGYLPKLKRIVCDEPLQSFFDL